MHMKKLSFAMVGAASLALAACTNSDDQVDENALNVETTENLDALAADAANQAEAEALGNQAAQLNESAENAAANASDGVETDSSEADAAVNGM